MEANLRCRVGKSDITEGVVRNRLHFLRSATDPRLELILLVKDEIDHLADSKGIGRQSLSIERVIENLMEGKQPGLGQALTSMSLMDDRGGELLE